jgi:multiple sugar transport system permease protein
VGLANFKEVLTNEQAQKAFLNTFRYALVIVPGVTIVAFVFALFVHQRWPGHTLARTGFFSPFVCAPTVVGLIWVWLLDTQFGLINQYLSQLGIPNIPWLTSPDWSWVGVSLTSIWWDAGFSFILFLAALQDVPQELIESAEIDGANRFQVVWNVILPMLRPVASMVVTLQLISTLRIFSQVVVMTNGGPAGSSGSVIFYLYQYGLQRYRFGYAAAVAVLLLIVTLFVTLLGRRLVREEIV